MEAVVLFEYEKQQDDELSLKVGEVILDVKQADEGWCEGVLNGEWGMFPDNFVQLRPVSSGKPPAPAPEAAPAPVPSEHHNANVSSSSALRGHLTPAAKKARRAKVTYSYVAENPDELNLQPGQVVEIVEEEEEGWWKGRVDGKEGLFPSNFVELVEQNGSSDPAHDYSVPPPLDKPPTVDHSMPRDRPEEAFGAAAPPRQSVLGPKLFPAFNPVEARSKLKATTPASKPPAQPLSAADRRMSAGTPKKPAAPPTAVPASKAAKPPAIPPSHPEKPPAKPPEKQVERAKVLFNYTAEQPDELSIKVGEVLEVVSKDVQEGWWEVRQGDQTGLIPDNFVELLPPQPAQPQQPPKPKPPPPSTEKAEPPPQPPAKAAPLPPTGKKPSAKSVPPHPPKSTEPSPPTEDSGHGHLTAAARKARRVRRYGFVENPDGLNQLQPGQVVETVEEKEEGWWKALLPSFPPSHPEKPPAKPPAKPPEKQVEWAKVLFNYTAEQPDEVTIKVGELLEVVSKDALEGWWEVRQGDQTGLIPDNFVELLPPQPAQPQLPPKPKPPPPSTEKAEPPPQPPAKAAPLPPTEAVVLFEYEKQQDDELSLKVGEVILDVKQVDEGWCEGVLNGERGMFPDIFVHLRRASSGKPPAPTPVPSEYHNADVSSSSALRGSASKKAHHARVTYSYAAENPDELDLQPGQVVELLEKEEEGWWKGRVDGKEGLFPSNFVEMLPVEEDGEARTGRQILEEALEKGYVLCSIIKVLTLGAAGSGKTHTKFRMLRENPPKTRCSTPLTEAAIRAISRVLIGTDLTGWFRVSYEDLMSMLAKALKAGVPMETTEQHKAMGARVQQLQKTLQRSQKVKKVFSALSSQKAKKASSASTQPSPSSEELVRLVEQSSGSKRFFEIQWINFIDSGGQPQFHELLPAFIRNANVIMFVLKLSERLDEQPMIEYYEKGQRCGDAQPCILRNDQILQHCIRTMHSRPSPSGEERECRVMMVGTHRDLESQCTETRAEKNEKILQLFGPDFCDELVFYRPFTEAIFPLNAKEPTEEDHQVVSTICEQISDKKFAPKPSKIPIGWFLLEQDIRKLAAELGRGVISMKECLHLATRLKINNEALKAALNYLDELNILLYYPSLLPNVLFVEPQALVDKSSELVAFNYKLRCEQISEAFTGKWKRFRDEGVVTLRMLEDKRFCCHYTPKLFTPTDLIKLFRRLLIFAPLTTDEYFMPSLLPMIPAEEVKRYCPPPSSTTAPLLVHFPNRCAPNGIYCALVVHLLSVCGWKLLYRSGRSPACVSRNCICLRLPGKPATVSLIDSFSFFEVHVETSSTKILHQIRESVFAGLENASHTLKYDDLKPVVAFFCDCGTPPHSATTYIDDEDRSLVCTQTSNSRPLCGKHAVWLGEQSSVCTPSADRPSLREMILFPGKATNFSIPQRIGTKFMQFGILLLNDDMGQRVESIALKHRSDCEQINLEILKEWLKGAGQPVSWRTLVGVLRDIRDETLARDIEAVKC